MSILNKAYFHDEAAAFEKLESIIWPEGPVCPHCSGKERIYTLKGVRTKPSKKNPKGIERHGLKKCGHCRKQFTARVGTVFESSHIPLHKWMQATHLLCSSKKGISSHQLHRILEITYEAAWFMSHRLREAMRDFFHRNANGISVTVLDFNDGQRVEIDDSQAATAVSSFIEPLQLLEALPARSAHGEIDGRLIAVGRWRNKPALYLHTALYGNVWCVLAPHLIEQWGGETRVSSIWTGKRLSIFGRLLYWKGGRLSRVEAESVRERVSPRIDIEDVLDADFTAGLDPVEYLDRLHEGKLG